jgi:hypothetical protein
MAGDSTASSVVQVMTTGYGGLNEQQGQAAVSVVGTSTMVRLISALGGQVGARRTAAGSGSEQWTVGKSC